MAQRSRIHVINLDERGKDRWEQIQRDFGTDPRIELVRFPAVERYGQDGCFESHAKVIEQHQDEEVIFVAEDDCFPILERWELFHEVVSFVRTQGLKLDWDCINFGISRF